MQETILKNLINILDKELGLYTEMRDLYAEKRKTLVKNDIEALLKVDAKIIENYEAVKRTDALRVKTVKLLGEDLLSMSDIINLVEKECPKFVNKLKEQQAKLNNLNSAISVLNLTNIELIKHGMIITDKKLDIIIDACAPKATSYSDKGVERIQDIEMSTIIKDA